ncbi:MAG: glycosyltransferase [Bacteroidales bacterium]|nr:glycosyltransferase [Bacteroidales bacterium]
MPTHKSDKHKQVTLSVIVAFRNEVQNINNLIKCLINQDFTEDGHEIILVNDNSEDQSAPMAQHATKDRPNCMVINIDKGRQGKKSCPGSRH